MRRTKLLARIGGVCCLAAGIMCWPLGYGINPKRDLSRFHNLADMHAFVWAGLVLVAVGVVALAASRLLPGDIDE